MSYEFPPAVLFPTIVRVGQVDRTPRVDGSLGEWSDEHRLPPLHELADGHGFGRLWMTWNDGGVYLALHVPTERPVVVNRQHPASGDCLELFIDTRAGQTGHRATQFCYHFWALPTGGGPGRAEPIIWQTGLPNALRRAAPVNADDLRIAAREDGDGWTMEIGLPAESLLGLEPRAGARLGLAMVIRNPEHGLHYWGTARELPHMRDPSTWSLVELADRNA